MLIQVGENEILTAMPPAFGTLPTPQVSAWPSSRGDTEYTSGRHLSLPGCQNQPPPSSAWRLSSKW